MLVLLCFLWAVVVALLIWRAVGQYGAYQQLPDAPRDLAKVRPPLTVITPARDERLNIEAFLRSMLAQDYPADRLRIILVDDGSSDGTGQIAGSVAGGDPRFRLITGKALPAGWKGKPFACWQAAQIAAQDFGVRADWTAQGTRAVVFTGGDAPGGAKHAGDDPWLCFIDCDTRAAPALLRCAIAHAEQHRLDLLSLEPFQELKTFWERVLIPAGFLLLAFSQDLRRVNDPAQPEAFANGQFILIRLRAYQAIGGHAATRAFIAEDSALARLVKSAGMRIAVLGAPSMLTTRMYRGLGELWEGISKILIEMIGGRGRTMFFAIAGVLLAVATLLLPPLAWWRFAGTPDTMSLIAAVCATAASLAFFGIHIGAAGYLRIPVWYGLLFPLGYFTGLPLALYSLWSRARHHIAWKGRIYGAVDAKV